MTALEYLTLRAPYYTANTRVPPLLILAEGFTGCLIGDRKEMAKALQVLHWLTISDRSSGGENSSAGVGSVQSEKEGDLSISYASPMDNASFSGSSDLSQTPWGVELEALLRSCMFFPRTRYSI